MCSDDCSFLSCRRICLFEREDKFETSIIQVVGFDVSTMEKYGVFYDRESQPGSSQFSGTTLVYPVEAFENMGKMLAVYTDSVIGERKDIFLRCFFRQVDEYIPSA